MCNETGHIIKAAWLDVMYYYNRLTRYLTRLGKSEVLLVPKLRLGNPYLASSYLVVLREAGASKTPFPSRSSRRYTQVRASRKIRHFGRDAEIQAMDGN